MRYARLVDNRAVDVSDEAPEGRFHPDVVAQFRPVPAAVVNGSIYDDAAGSWSPPEAIVVPPAPVLRPVVATADFRLLLSFGETAAMRASDSAAAAYILGLIDDSRTASLDLNVSSLAEAIQALEGDGLLAAGRAAQVLAAQPPA